MTHATERQEAGRRLFHRCIVDVDRCRLRYGVSPCTAVLGTDGERKCFNTFDTCQDRINYDKNSVIADVKDTTIKDATTGANDGTINGGVFHNSSGGAFHDGASGTYTDFGDDDLFTPSVLVAEAWIFPTSDPNSAGNILSKAGNTDWRFRRSINGSIAFFDRGATNSLNTEIGLVPLNKWSFIQVKGLASGLQIGVNGQIVASNSTPFGANNGTGALIMGAFSAATFTEQFAGTIMHARIWSVDRSEDETRESMWDFLSGLETGLNWYVPCFYNPPAVNRTKIPFVENVQGFSRITMIPVLKEISTAPTRIDPGRSIGERASITIKFKDTPHHDRGDYPSGPLDKYAYQRNEPDPTVVSLIDSTPAANHGTVNTGSPKYVNGILGQGVRLTGTDLIRVTDASDVYGFENRAAFAVSFWLQVREDLTVNNSVIDKLFNDVNGTQGWNIGIDPVDSQVFARRWFDGTNESVVWTGLTPFETVHVSVAYGGTLLILAINGTVEDSIVSTNNIKINGAALEFFAGASSDVIMDDIRIFDSGAVLLSSRDHEIDPNTNNLVGYWKCNAEKSLAGGSLYDPFEQGTLFSKLRKRSPYYQGRAIVVQSGYIPHDRDELPSEQPSQTYFTTLGLSTQSRTYIQEKWTGPDSNGNFSIVAKDVLKLIDDDRAQVPAANTGRLLLDLSRNETTAQLTPTGVGDAEYPASGTVRINDEFATFTRAGDVLTFTERASDNTILSDHNGDDTVQLVERIDQVRVDEILRYLIQDIAGVNAEFIPIADWNSEFDQWRSLAIFSALISIPTGVRTLVQELIQQSLIDLWWDEVAQEIKLRPMHPERTAPPTIDDVTNIVEGSFKIREKPEDRLTNVVVWYDRFNPAVELTERTNFRKSVTSVDADAESAKNFDDSRNLTVFSRWFTSGNEADALTLASRMLALYRKVPLEFICTLSAKDTDLWTGDIVEMQHRLLVDGTGAKETKRVQVVSVKEHKSGQFQYEFRRDPFDRRYGYIGPNTLLDYGSETQANKDLYAFIAPDENGFSNGDEPYRII